MLKSIFIKLSTLLLTVLILSACTTNNIETTITDNNYKTLCTPLKLKEKEILLVALPSNHFSGYHWEIEDGASSILQLLDTRTIKSTPSNKGGIHQQNTSWQFKSFASGNATLSFIYKLAWDANVPDTQRITCPITVSNK